MRSKIRVVGAMIEKDGRYLITTGFEAAPGTARLAMTVTEAILNAHGMCHGGAIFSLADAGFFYACNSGGVQSVALGYVPPSILEIPGAKDVAVEFTSLRGIVSFVVRLQHHLFSASSMFKSPLATIVQAASSGISSNRMYWWLITIIGMSRPNSLPTSAAR